ncbi:hypothetical protein ACMYSQ_012426 [Aspergillus niger]
MSDHLTLAKTLQKADLIAFNFPSARLNDRLPQSLARGQAVFESLGFRVKIIYTRDLDVI